MGAQLQAPIPPLWQVLLARSHGPTLLRRLTARAAPPAHSPGSLPWTPAVDPAVAAMDPAAPPLPSWHSSRCSGPQSARDSAFPFPAFPSSPVDLRFAHHWRDSPVSWQLPGAVVLRTHPCRGGNACSLEPAGPSPMRSRPTSLPDVALPAVATLPTTTALNSLLDTKDSHGQVLLWIERDKGRTR